MLTQNLIDIIIDVMKSFNPIKIGVFSSVARNEATEGSDIDILYQFKNTMGLFKLIDLKQDLEKKQNKKVDFVSENYINPKLKPYILNDLNIIYGNE